MSPTQNTAASIFAWLLVLVAMIVAGFVLVAWVTRRLRASDDSSSGGFTLSDLREMRRQGRITEEEFERAKVAMLASMRARDLTRKDPPKE
ncbi:MAG: hypothetical protein ABSH20_13675 [Tepidisphaeraceae bacterium]